MTNQHQTWQGTKLTGHNGSIYALAPGDRGSFYSGGGEGWIVKWNPTESPDGRLVAKTDDQVFSLLKIAGNNQIVAGTMNGNMYFIDLDRTDQTRNLEYHNGSIFDLLQLGQHCIAAGGDGILSIWDWTSQSLVESIALSHQRLRGLAISPDRQLLAVASSDHCIYLLHVGSWKVFEVLKEAHDNSVFSLAFSLDGSQLISGGRDAHLKVWSVNQNFNLLRDLPAHWYTINALAIHPKGLQLATASRDKTIRLWNAHTLQPETTLDTQRYQGHINSVNDIIWLTESQLVSASDDRCIIVWQSTPIEN